MRSLIGLFAAVALMAGTLFFMFTNNVIAGDNAWRQGMRQACNENQRAGAERQKCYNRYGLGTAPIFRDEKRNNQQYGWNEPRRPRYYDNHRRPRHENRYLYSRGDVPNQDLLALFGLGYGIAKAISEMDREPQDDCRVYFDEYGEREEPVCD